MANYHVGCGATGIFAGTLNKRGDMWVNKSEVTDETFAAVTQYCIEHSESMEFEYKGGHYMLLVQNVGAEMTRAEMTRAEAIKILKEIEYPVNGDNKECRDMAFKMAIKALEQEPCVNAIPETGRWIPIGYDGYADGNPVYDWWECSECGWEHTGDEESLTVFCPNCGAKMKEVEE